MFAHLVEMLTAHYFSSDERSAQDVDVIVNMTHDVVFQKPFLYVAISISVVNVFRRSFTSAATAMFNVIFIFVHGDRVKYAKNIGRMLMGICMKRRLLYSRHLLRTFLSSTRGH